MVECSPHKQIVAGSIPAGPTKQHSKTADVGRFSAKVKKRAEKRTFLPFWAKKEQKKALFRPKNLHMW